MVLKKSSVALILAFMVTGIQGRSLEETVHTYNSAQNNFGQGISEAGTPSVEELLAAGCTKRANGIELVQGSENFSKQLTELRNGVGGWTVKETFVIPSADGTQCATRYVLESKNAGSFDVLAVMRSSNQETIEAIDEIYCPCPADRVVSESVQGAAAAVDAESSLLKLVEAYITAHNQFGQSTSCVLPDEYRQLLSPNFKRIGNGKVLAADRDSLEKDLNETKQAIGAYSIAKQWSFLSADKKQCIIRYTLTTAKEGNYDVLAVISSADGKHIDSLDGVFCEVPAGA